MPGLRKLHNSQTSSPLLPGCRKNNTSTKLHNSQTPGYRFHLFYRIIPLRNYTTLKHPGKIDGMDGGIIPLRNYTTLKQMQGGFGQLGRIIPLRNYTTLKQLNDMCILLTGIIPLRNYTTLKHNHRRWPPPIWNNTSTKLHNSQTSNFGRCFGSKNNTSTKLHNSQTFYRCYMLHLKE